MFEKYLNQISPHKFKPVTNEVWETILDEGLDEEFDAPCRKNWKFMSLEIDEVDKENLKKFEDETVEKFNLFDIKLKDLYKLKLIDFIDYDNGIVVIVCHDWP